MSGQKLEIFERNYSLERATLYHETGSVFQVACYLFQQIPNRDISRLIPCVLSQLHFRRIPMKRIVIQLNADSSISQPTPPTEAQCCKRNQPGR